MIPSLIRLYCSVDRFLKMLLSACESREGQSAADSSSSSGSDVAQPTRFYLLQDLEGHGGVVVLQRGDVVVAQRQLSASIYLSG